MTEQPEQQNGNLAQTPGAPEKLPLQLSSEEGAVVRQKDAKLGQLKFQLGALQLEIFAAEQRRAQLCQEIATAQNDFGSYAGDLARQRGIDPNDPKAGKWTLDMGAMTFAKQN